METQSSSTSRISRKRVTLVTSFIFLLLPVVVLADDCSFEREVAYTLATEGIRQLDIEARAGSLSVRASESGADVISVKGRLCSSHQSDLEGMDVLQSRRGDVQYLETLIPEVSSSWWTSRYAYLDLDVTVPPGFAVAIDDGSGPMVISDTGDLRIKDGSGGISVHGIVGNIVIRDGSGELTVEDVDGRVEVRDGSGTIDISLITGDVEVDDGSGTLQISEVSGRVDIRDGSGSIEVRDVAREVVVHESGSGSVDLRRVNTSKGEGGPVFDQVAREVIQP